MEMTKASGGVGKAARRAGGRPSKEPEQRWEEVNGVEGRNVSRDEHERKEKGRGCKLTKRSGDWRWVRRAGGRRGGMKGARQAERKLG